MLFKQDLKIYSVMILVSATFIVSFRNNIPGTRKYIYEPPVTSTSIYLTIDDGPSAASQYINNIAVTDSALINIFVIGARVYKNDSLHTLFNLYQTNPFIETGNHSFLHANGHYHNYYSHPQEVISDFILNADTLSLKNKIARLPGRNTWRLNGRKRTDLPDDSTAADILVAQGYRVFGWDIEWHCHTDSNHHILPAAVFMNHLQNIIRTKRSFTPGHIVILCHESMFTDSSNRLQLDTLIRTIKQKNNCLLRHLSTYP
jgi:hypothetical protein